jgi:cyclophilin family peptidyl-prolyl cis-trans isomerase/predicted small secreted protein
MNSRFLTALLLLAALILSGCATAPRTAGTGPQVAVMTIAFPKKKKKTETARVVIQLDDKAAPGAAENFRTLIARKYYDGMRFHRAFPHQLVQTGDPKSRLGLVGSVVQKAGLDRMGLDFSDTARIGTGGPGYTLPPEIRLKLDKGAVAAGRLPDAINPARLSNGSQFFVCIAPMPQLNGQYTVFGHVTEGLDVLDAISASPTDSNDLPSEEIIIRSIRME